MAHKNQSNWSPYKARKDAKSASSKAAGKPTGKSGKPAPGSKPEAPTRHRKSSESYSFNQADDRIQDVFRNHGFEDYPHAKRQKLTQFYMLLMSNQNERNFTRLLNIRDVAIKHFIDSLIVANLRPLMFPLIDMGTGPGFPGIPLAIHHPDKKVILAEGVQKRVEFLKSVREELDLPNLPIIGRNLNAEFFYPVNGVITRAVEDARNTLGNVINSIQTGGEVVLMKGPNCTPEIQMALDAWGEYFSLAADIEYELPKSPHQRRLLVFKKLKPHPLPDFEALDLKWEREFGQE
ncbi:MAG: RsmG family class I SAM-dependent methyltransferase [Bdellovibrionota bacterium]